MKYLYVDNFRGFSDTIIPIMDVNFLVGENSTGKSSILGLINLLATPDFWLRQKFTSEEVQFGNFRDIVSVNATDKSYFSFGLVFDLTKPDDESAELIAFQFTFVEREGLPVAGLYTYARNGREYRLRIGPRQIKFKTREVNTSCGASDFTSTTFIEWKKAFKDDTSGYTVAPDNIFAKSHNPPVFLAAAIEDYLSDKEPKFPGSAIVPAFSDDIAWLAPIRTKPRRTYDEYRLDFSPEGDHTPYVIKKLLDKKSEAIKFREFLAAIGKDSGLFESVIIKKYGTGVTAPFELDVVLNKKQLGISNVGYGVSQALPIIVEMFVRKKGSWYALQQPEVHLHPRAQAALGDAFFTLASVEKKRFIIETHSDYTIDRFRVNYRTREDTAKPMAQVIYFERTGKGNKAYILQIDDQGNLPDDQPSGYREFFLKEEMSILGL